MKVGFIGLGKMGGRMAERLLEKKFKVIVYARHPASMKPLVRKGAQASSSYKDFCAKLGKNRKIFIMVTHGKAVDGVIKGLKPFLAKGDIIIDGGNSFYKDSIRRGKSLAKKKVEFLDAGVSGGLQGARNGASVMAGGTKSAFKKAEPIFRALAVKNGYAYMGKSGAGHFVKMAHNGIEYALLQSYGEGFQMLEKSPFKLNLRGVAKVYRNGSVIRGWLMDLLAEALEKDVKLKRFSGKVGGGSTGTWALKTAGEMRIKAPMLEAALRARKNSAKKPDFSTKVVSALRFGFGGHLEPGKKS